MYLCRIECQEFFFVRKKIMAAHSEENVFLSYREVYLFVEELCKGILLLLAIEVLSALEYFHVGRSFAEEIFVHEVGCIQRRSGKDVHFCNFRLDTVKQHTKSSSTFQCVISILIVGNERRLVNETLPTPGSPVQILKMQEFIHLRNFYTVNGVDNVDGVFYSFRNYIMRVPRQAAAYTFFCRMRRVLINTRKQSGNSSDVINGLFGGRSSLIRITVQTFFSQLVPDNIKNSLNVANHSRKAAGLAAFTERSDEFTRLPIKALATRNTPFQIRRIFPVDIENHFKQVLYGFEERDSLIYKGGSVLEDVVEKFICITHKLCNVFATQFRSEFSMLVKPFLNFSISVVYNGRGVSVTFTCCIIPFSGIVYHVEVVHVYLKRCTYQTDSLIRFEVQPGDVGTRVRGSAFLNTVIDNDSNVEVTRGIRFVTSVGSEATMYDDTCYFGFLGETVDEFLVMLGHQENSTEVAHGSIRDRIIHPHLLAKQVC